MTVDLNKPFVDLALKPVPESNMGKIIAQTLSSSNKEPALKIWGWCVKLHAGEHLELDDPDLKLFKKLIEESDQFAVLAKAQILKALDA